MVITCIKLTERFTIETYTMSRGFMGNRYKLKSDAMVHHLDGVTKITLGTLCVDIE